MVWALQARDMYPILIVHAQGNPTTVNTMQPIPLRSQDFITIADACFYFQRQSANAAS